MGPIRWINIFRNIDIDKNSPSDKKKVRKKIIMGKFPSDKLAKKELGNHKKKRYSE